ncbi:MULTISPECIES: putative hydro-lyase [Acinetobacter]|uniref:putative hydro-lyase n=1 Tax=Acinetobacter TaxID=469 RepID=UPI000D6E73CE|nr:MULTISPECIES: putative hydro-lyase [Acinetobacter]HAV4234177.1 putative hydro-lyase [Acinetobacter baumannii ATCC 17978]EMC1590740.1 putative hydro-lyase [Acinetobacter baumannii]MBD0542156.1 putative hydro-lyase [Acinetobacter baumannii]MCE6086402.1 putative hydro-lyase [Acinetobacter baumannii]MCE6090258.1 putative hydro-lyase [Acinetobacter baumannii]
MNTMYKDIKVDPAQLEAALEARLKIRAGFDKPTAGMAAGMTQVNMISVPKEWAYDFLLYAHRNPQSCPVLDVLEEGIYATKLAADSDIRTDFPRYRVWKDGEMVDEVTDASEIYNAHPDLVTFLIGCSFSFETALQEAGIEVRHIHDDTNVPMYLSNIKCEPAGRISGNMVVSMRPIPSHQISEAVKITARMPSVHGAPVHIGHPESLGIKDVNKPDFGDASRIEAGEIPVFWACGVTPQAAVMNSKIPFAISHAPGYMFITDIPDRAWIG